MKRIFFTFTLIFALLLCTTSTATYGYNVNFESELFNKANVDVSYNEILKKVDFGLKCYFADGSQKRSITPSSKWIPLSTIEGIRFAFLVPLNENNVITGYAVIGAIDGNYRMLELTLDEEMLTKKLLTLSNSHIITYRFPSGFIYKQNDNLYTLDDDLNEVAVNKNITSFKSELKNQIQNQSINIDDKSSQGIYAIPLVDYAYLSDYSTFVPVDGYYYGGDQHWLGDTPPGYMSTFWAKRACGPTAVANASYHMSKHKSGMSNLYDKSSISKTDFRSYMNEVYDYVTPDISGIRTIDSIANKFENFASSKNVSLSRVIDNSPWTINNISSYIKEGVLDDSPVLMITYNTPNGELDYHWVTITGYFYDVEYNERTVTVANNGKKQIHDLNAWYSDGSFYQGLIYFD